MKTYEDVLFEVLNPLLIDKFPHFQGKMFFANERSRQPRKPYLMLIEINDETIHRPYERNGVVTEIKQATVTFQVNVSGVENGSNNPENKYFAKSVRDYLRNLLCCGDVVDCLLEQGVSSRFENMSKNRDDTEPTSGGFIYIYEFDCPFEYKILTEFETTGEAQGVNIELNNKNDGNVVKLEINKEKNIGY